MVAHLSRLKLLLAERRRLLSDCRRSPESYTARTIAPMWQADADALAWAIDRLAATEDYYGLDKNPP